jgi:hypothetical protein
MNWKIVAAVVVVLAVGGLGWYLQRNATPEPEPIAVAPPPVAAVPVTPPAPPPEAPAPKPRPERKVDTTPLIAAPPTLDNSDGQVQAALIDLSPKLAEWLNVEEQVRKWVMLIDQVAAGKLPAKNRPLQYPMPAFAAGATLQADPANYARADVLIETVTAIAPARLARYYQVWRPTLDKAYSELGGSGGFDKRLRLALRRVLQAQPLPASAELVRPGVYYKYADARLEQASDVEKLMWRLGPQNMKRAQDYLRELEQEL